MRVDAAGALLRIVPCGNIDRPMARIRREEQGAAEISVVLSPTHCRHRPCRTVRRRRVGIGYGTCIQLHVGTAADVDVAGVARDDAVGPGADLGIVLRHVGGGYRIRRAIAPPRSILTLS